ncbi:MAG: UvrD-helicase domain-containing protein [Chlorobi bacterium]|nr:UvrD-helicase domain-containing protein [Chlorobiota bacterium]
MQDYLNQLNKAQREAVINTEGPALIIAGAGSGKTRVLTYRIAYLLQKGVKPWRILALTFTNKAAKEMRERIASLIGEEKAKYLWAGTFHSIFAKFLRKEAELLGYPSDFTVYDTQDSKSIIKSIIKELQLDDKIYKPANIYGRISSAKNNLITPAMYEANQNIRIQDEKSRRPELYRIYKIYAQRCFKAGAMDFDDLLLKTNILFRKHPEILRKYQEKFDYILVDEYQDTNLSQYLIIKKLGELHKNVCVVGDDAQSIYSFRGAKIENILNFKNDYKNYKLFKLEQNYRSTRNIVEAANSVISKNTRRIKKDVYSENEEGSKIKIIEALTDSEEGFITANKISESVLSGDTKYSDHAVLYRTNAQSRIFEEAFRRSNIPYRIYGGLSFYQRKEIKDLLAYFKFTVNKRDNESLKRIINYPKRGIGKTTVEKTEYYAEKNNLSMWEVIKKLSSVDIGLNKRAVNQILAFADMIEEFSGKIHSVNAYELGREIAQSSGILKELFSDKSPEALAKYENVQELINGLKEFVETAPPEENTLNYYLESVALLTDEDTETDEDRNKVTLMTVHSAKGLEFSDVYVAGMEEKLFPSEMSSFSPEDIEEERRLFYVAMTRAKNNLTLTYAGQRYKWGQLYDCSPSRFIKDINPEYIDFYSAFGKNDINFSHSHFAGKNITNIDTDKTANSGGKPNFNRKLTKIENVKSSVVPSTYSDLEIKEGAKVKHGRFGTGTVLKVEGTGQNAKALIKFEVAGTKNLLLKFAKLEPAD